MSVSNKPCVVIAAGGTGGHLFPAAAFADEMFQRGWRVILVTDARGRRYAENFPAERIVDVPAASLTANPIQAIPAAFKIMRGIAASKKHFADWKPALVAGFGGYPSFPALMAAKAMKIPFIIHEQNSVLGRVNRAMAKDAAIVACGFERLDRLPPEALARKRVVGNPVREPILAVREQPYPPIPAGGQVHLLVIGGSQGARLFGEVIPAAVALLPEDLRRRLCLTQQVRDEQLAGVRKQYAQMGVAADTAPFFSAMADLYRAAHLVIARAGASSVTELQAAGRPAILVPFAAAADDHQTANAEGLTAVGAADVFSEAEFNAPSLARCLQERLSDPHGLSVRAAAARSTGKPEAAKTLADLAQSAARPS
jgi:UDP-N-acetylglucosamine--N-acetylmuramyl-(pentapeptide) pyrophosphoryl-undecaprenol N-acetylglucosamine transferase